MSVFSKIWNFLKGLISRPGLQQFLAKYMAVAVRLLKDLADTHSNQEFHEWKDLAFRELQAITGELKGNWISILIGLAYEELKARNQSSAASHQ